jgi:hypothetical protein
MSFLVNFIIDKEVIGFAHYSKFFIIY